MEQIDVAKGISEFGMLAVTAGFFLVFSAGMLLIFVRFFVKLINDIITEQKQTLSTLTTVSTEQKTLLSNIHEGLRDETLARIKIVSNQAFDLNKFDVQRMIKRIREENNIDDREATTRKIRRLLKVSHDNRNSKFDHFKFRGKSLTHFTDEMWIEKIANVVEGEIYSESGINNGRAFTNVSACLEDIKIEFYHNLIRN